MKSFIHNKSGSIIYFLIWWILSTGIFLFIYIPATNQIELKLIIPFLLIVLLVYEKKVVIDRALWCYIFLTLWGGLSILYSLNILVTQGYLQMLTGNIIIWYIAARCLKKINSILVLSYPVFLALCIQAYFTITAPIEQASNVVNQGLERVTGLSRNENDQARVLLFGAVIAILIILYSRNRLVKITTTISIFGFVLGILKTGSRECFLALGAMTITFIFLVVKEKKKYGYLVLAIVIVTVLYNLGYNYILDNTVLGRRMQIAVNQGEQNIRFTLIKEGWDFFLTHPIFGIGLGSFTTLSSSNLYSHNDYIEILSTMGLPAFIIYINIYVDYVRKGRKLFLQYNGYYKKAILVGISFLIGYLCLGMFDPIFYYQPTTLMLAFYYTLISKVYYQYKFQKATQVSFNVNDNRAFDRTRNFKKIYS